jgi:hypothetical protein
MARDRSTPLRAVVDDRARKRRSGELDLAAALDDERQAARREDACAARHVAAVAALAAAETELRRVLASGATAGAIAAASAHVARVRRDRDAAAADLDAARTARAAVATRTDGARADLGRAHADEKVAERLRDRVVAEARRTRERREDD